MNYERVKIRITDLFVGDVIEHDGDFRTCCQKDFGGDSFIGSTIFGDSYNLGNKPVILIDIKGE